MNGNGPISVGTYLIDSVGVVPRIDCPACGMGICANRDHREEVWVVTEATSGRSYGLFSTRNAAILGAYRMVEGEINGRI